MILVDVYVPVVDKNYDFHLDETSSIQVLLEEMSEMICQKEQCSLNGDHSDLTLCCMNRKMILPGYSTLRECQVQTGSRLLLV